MVILREIQINTRINTVEGIIAAVKGVNVLKPNQLKTNTKPKNKQSKWGVV